jgi:hypothetical protein
MGTVENQEGGEKIIERGGLDRRTLIKRAAVAGAVAWTAPVIIESLASPAAAITGPHGCTGIKLNGNCTTDSQSTPCSFSLCSTTNTASASACVHKPSDCSGSSSTVVFTIQAGCETCTFSNAIGRATGGGAATCVTPTGIGTKTITFQTAATSSNNQYSQFAINVTCA